MVQCQNLLSLPPDLLRFILHTPDDEKRALCSLRTALLRNVSAAHPAVRLLPLHDLLAPRYGWHQQDCKVREVARARGALPADGCDCTHYCWSPHFWRHYFAALRDAVRQP